MERTKLLREMEAIRESLSASEEALNSRGERLQETEGEVQTLRGELENAESRLNQVNNIIRALDRSLEVIQRPRPVYSPADICGLYRVTGTNPGVDPLLYRFYRPPQSTYKGELHVGRAGEAFTLAWTIKAQKGAQTAEGTGLLEADVLSVAFEDTTQGNEAFRGVISYRVVGPGQLRGSWTHMGGERPGWEKCVRVDESQSTPEAGTGENATK